VNHVVEAFCQTTPHHVVETGYSGPQLLLSGCRGLIVGRDIVLYKLKIQVFEVLLEAKGLLHAKLEQLSLSELGHVFVTGSPNKL
jgi:hypothetical protein